MEEKDKEFEIEYLVMLNFYLYVFICFNQNCGKLNEI